MPSQPWYPHYSADYDAKTAHLSILEHGAYRLLLDWAYRREGCLPTDLSTIYRTLRASSKKDRAAIRSILGQFWVIVTDLYRNDRVDQEIAKRQLLSQKRSASAKQMHMQLHTQSQSQSLLQKKEEEKKETPKEKSRPLALLAEFDEFWKIYPKKEGKKAAFKAYEKARREGVDAGILNFAVQTYKGLRASEDSKYTKHPASWLNQGCWMDENAPTGSATVIAIRPEIALAQALEEENYRKRTNGGGS